MRTIAKKYVLTICIVAIFCFCAWWLIFTIPGWSSDSYAPRYLLWKCGVLGVPSDIVYEAMLGDSDRNDIVRGLTRTQVAKAFAVESNKSTLTDHQSMYENQISEDHMWLGDSWWVVLFRDGKAYEIRLFKG